MKEGKQNLEEILEKIVENISDNTREDVSNQKYIDKIKGITILTKKYKDKKGCVENKGISLNEMKEILKYNLKKGVGNSNKIHSALGDIYEQIGDTERAEYERKKAKE